MKSQLKKLTAIFLSICVVLSLTSVISFAAETTATLSFASTAQRTSQTTTAQVWENDGVKFTNNKSASTSSVIDSSNPVRLYANSEVIVEYSNMNITKIVFNANSTTYATALKNSIGAEATVSSKVVTVIPTEVSSTFTIAKLTAQVRLDSLTVTGTPAITDCEHVNTTTTTEPAGKTTEGKTTVTCDDCGVTVSTTPIPALGCTVSYVVPEGEADGVDGVLEVILPEPEALTGDYAKEYEFAGWAEAEVELTDKVPALYDAGQEVTLEDDTTFYAVYQYSEKSDIEVPVSNSYVKKDLGDIVATDTVIITMAKSGTVYALTSINGSSSAPTAKSITVTNNEIASADDEFLWTVENTVDGYVFHTASDANKWLYCINNNNGVRVGTSAEKYFEISSNYLKNIDRSRYLGIYNTQDWRSYTSINTNIQNQTLAFYAKSASDGTVTYYTTTLESNTPAGSIDGANIEVGTDLAANFYADVTKLTDPKMTFALGTEEAGDPVGVATDANGSYFAFEGIPPHYMTETITATLYDGDKVVTTLTKTIKDIAMAYLNGDYADKVKTFAANMLNYGAASQNYMNKNTDKLANNDVDGYGTTNAPDASVAEGIGLSNNAGYIKSANVWFDNKNNIIVKFQNLPENAKLIVKKDGVQEFSGLASESYKTNDLLATELDAIYTFTIQDAEGEELQSLTYSVNYYTYAKRNSASMGALAIALYNYGASAELVK